MQAARHCVLAIPVVFVANDCVVSVAKVEGRSMQPTLNPAEEGPRDRVVVDKFSLTVGRTPKRGDVFLVRSPHDPDGWLVKRMIAIEGDTVRTRSDEMVHVPQGHCWIEGDNAACSDDSGGKLGPVPLALLEGRVLSVVWPPWRMHRVKNAFSQERVSLGYHHSWP